jgi:hypothetical protein
MEHPLHLEPEQRPRRLALAVRGVALAQRLQAGAASPQGQDLDPAQQLDPGEPPPVVVVAVDAKSRLGTPAHVAETRGLGRTLGLLVDRAPDEPLRDGIGDGQDARMVVLVEKGETGHSLRLD